MKTHNKKVACNSSSLMKQTHSSVDREIKEMVTEYYNYSLKQKKSNDFFNQIDIERQRNFLLNYQFYVSEFYIDHLKARNYEFIPDLDWKYIDFFKFKTYDKITCPVCLNTDDDIINPHISLCGHIYCLYCIVRHLKYGKEKCPICQTACNFSD